MDDEGVGWSPSGAMRDQKFPYNGPLPPGWMDSGHLAFIEVSNAGSGCDLPTTSTDEPDRTFRGNWQQRKGSLAEASVSLSDNR